MTVLYPCLKMVDGDCDLPVSLEERRIILDFIEESESDINENDTVYVVSSRWWRVWQAYVGVDAVNHSIADLSSMVLFNKTPRPGPIDNSDIVMDGLNGGIDNVELRPNLFIGDDYVAVPEEVWNKLIGWYKGGPALPRKLIVKQLGEHKEFMCEIYPLRLHIIDSRYSGEFTVLISGKASVRELYNRIIVLFKLEQEKVCLWNYYRKKKISMLTTFNHTLEDANLLHGQHVLVEVKSNWFWNSGNELALVPYKPMTLSNGCSTSGYNSGSMQESGLTPGLKELENGHELTESSYLELGSKDNTALSNLESFRGLKGLKNLGNTCFMNSALQCLFHTPPLVEYFSRDYREEINLENPLGQKGEFAVAFGELLRTVWLPRTMTIVPDSFKTRLNTFASQFGGYDQHDSQEFLACILDGLHEDLNRIKNKPCIEAKDANGCLDEEFADKCWANHKARNDSVIVDFCQGQYKSALSCAVCCKVSVIFDPFMYLSLPLPLKATRSMTIRVFYADGRAIPRRYTVSVLNHGKCKDLTQALSIACCLESDESILIAKVVDHRIKKYMANASECLCEIKDNEHLVAYRFPFDNMKLYTIFKIYHRPEESYLNWSNDRSTYCRFFGTPLVTFLPKNQVTLPDIHSAVSKVLAPFSQRKAYLLNSPTKIREESDCCNEGIAERDEMFGHDISYSLLNGQFALEKLPEEEESISLFSCLEAFLKEEALGVDNMWFCPTCKEHRQATKKLDLWRLPDILVFHLKRFSYSHHTNNKLDVLVDFPIHDLNLSKYMKDKTSSHVYELYAVTNHYGDLNGGHYTAYAKLLGDKWFHFDDDKVYPIDEDSVRTSAAYILFYQRVKGGTITEVEEASSPCSPDC